jgi:hypothetical protein
MMQVIKKIIKILFVLLIFLKSINVYGYGLTYDAQILNISDDKTSYVIRVLSMAKASEDSVDEYNSRKSAAGAWITSNGDSDDDTSGGTGSFSTFYYGFYPNTQPDNPKYIEPPITNYGSGFVSNGTNSNIYYDSSTTPITVNSDNFNTFSGVASNVARNQGTDMDNYFKITKSTDLGVKHIQWRVTQARS